MRSGGSLHSRPERRARSGFEESAPATICQRLDSLAPLACTSPISAPSPPPTKPSLSSLEGAGNRTLAVPSAITPFLSIRVLDEMERPQPGPPGASLVLRGVILGHKRCAGIRRHRDLLAGLHVDQRLDAKRRHLLRRLSDRSGHFPR